jgi:polysaccharide biosynthesis/export protein
MKPDDSTSFDRRLPVVTVSRVVRLVGAILLVFVLPVSLGFAQEPAAQDPKASSANSTAEAPPAPPLPPAKDNVGADYLIGPGDTLQIFVWRSPELSTAVPVRPDGRISTPLVEDIVAVGKTSTQLAREIETRLKEYIRAPQVSVIVTNPLSAFSKITVIGKVGKPGGVPYRKGMTLLDVVSAVGGLAEFSAGNRAKLVRKDEKGVSQEIPVRLDDLMNKGKLKANMDVEPGDVLIVPESYF